MKRFIAILLLSIMMLFGCAPVNTPSSTEESVPPSADDSQGDVESEDEPTEENKDWTEDGKLKILTIGNSFSDDTMQYVYQIARDAGVESLSLGNLFIGGCSLNTHAANARGDKGAYEYRTNKSGTWSTVKNYKMGDAIKSENWDFISLQQASGSSGIESTYSELSYLIKYVKGLCPDAKIVWNMTWAYQQNTTHSDFPKYGSDQMTMYNAILGAVEKKVEPRDDVYAISPTGTAIQNARTSYVGDTITRDGYHLSYDFGRYIAGLTFFHKLTGLSIENVSFVPEGVDENMKKIAIESAVNAVKAPREITKSQYTQEPAFDESKYTKLEISWTAYAYWYSSHATNHHTLVTGASNSKSFYATPMFTKEQIPVGSVIMLAEGWQYRPEAWKSAGVQSSRPGGTSTGKITVTEAWWGDYTHRAFNLSKIGSPALTGIAQSEIDAAFTIWIPKN